MTKEENKLNFRAYDILTEHIFEYETKLANATLESERIACKKRIEVYEYLLKLTGGMVIDTGEEK